MKFRKYNLYNADDFAKDSDFIRWVVQANEEDNSFWQTYLLQHPDKLKEVEHAREIITQSKIYFGEQHLTAEEITQIHDNLMENVQSMEATSPPKKLISFSMRWAWAAVILLFVALASIFIVLTQSSQLIVYQTDYGEIKRITLPDGSNVQLNANSRLFFQNNWDEVKERSVTLDGEAFFEVEKEIQTHRKFQVHTSKLTIEVLGTHFNVNSRSKKTRVVLNEGKIRLNLKKKQAEEILMCPGDLVDYSYEKDEFIQMKVKADLHSSWKEGIQLFEKASLNEIIEKIEELYGVRIDVADKELLERNLTIGIPIEDLRIAFETLENVLSTEISLHEDRTYILE